MKKLYVPYVNAVNKMSAPVFDRRRIIALAIGQAVACNMQLPSGVVSSAGEYYDASVRPQVLSLISAFNEESVLDARACADFTRRFFLMRYDAFAKCPRRDRPQLDFFYAFFGVTNFFSIEDLTFINDNKDAIFDIYTAVCDCLTEALDVRLTPSESAVAEPI